MKPRPLILPGGGQNKKQSLWEVIRINNHTNHPVPSFVALPYPGSKTRKQASRLEVVQYNRASLPRPVEMN